MKNLRHKRVRRKISAKSNLPRLVVFRSNFHIYGQIIDDQKSITLAAASDIKSKNKNRMEKAKETGIDLAKAATKKNINKVVFDRAGYKYHGRVKALADGAREGGLTF